MAQIRHLRNAPIIEAIVDFRVKARPGFQPDEFGALRPQLEARFPNVTKQRGMQAEFQIGPDASPQQKTIDLGMRGFFFKSRDTLEIAQFRIDGFTFNRLKPYTSWDHVFPTALDLWSTYVEIAQPEAITRVALRFINHIDLPNDLDDFSEVMTAPPPVPAALPQQVSRFLTRITIHDLESQTAAHVSQALETDPRSRLSSLILDIDAFREQDADVHDKELTGTFDRLHEFKNRIFFESLTEQTIERYE